MREILWCSVGSALKWARPRVGEVAGTWWASPGVRSSLRRGVAARNGEEKAGVELEVREWWRKQMNGQREGVSGHA